MITVHVLSYNEEIFVQFMIDHYRERFPNCNIILYDNESTDNTMVIAKQNNCDVVSYSTNKQIVDSKYLEIKNNCWKNSKTDWNLVCDMDELLDINEQQLSDEQNNNVNIVKSEAYNMVNLHDNYDLKNITHGSRCEPYDKYYLFNKKHIKEINYAPGCHNANPVGNVKYSDKKYLLYHYKCINPEMMANRYAEYATRLSPENKAKGYGNHYNQTPEFIKANFNLWRQGTQKIR